VVREEEDFVMQRVNEYRFYELGQKIRAIHGLDPESSYSDFVWPLYEAREALTKLLDDVVALRISLAVVERVNAAITTILPMNLKDALEKAKQAPGSPPVTVGWSAYELNESLKAFEPVLSAECNALDTYVVSQKRGYLTSDLVDHAERMLPVETLGTLLPSVSIDIKAAGRCLAFDTPTAAGFHILRAVEAVMALYYKHLTGRELPKQNRNWGLYLKKLEGVPTHDKKIYGALDHIRDNYRNPITHPEDTLTEGQAIMLFGLSLSVVELMAEVLRTTSPALTEVDEMKALTEIAEAKAASAMPDDF
jgi:hypothetical protein